MADEKWVGSMAKAVEESLYALYSTYESLYKIQAMAILNQLDDRENTWIARCVPRKRLLERKGEYTSRQNWHS